MAIAVNHAVPRMALGDIALEFESSAQATHAEG